MYKDECFYVQEVLVPMTAVLLQPTVSGAVIVSSLGLILAKFVAEETLVMHNKMDKELKNSMLTHLRVNSSRGGATNVRVEEGRMKAVTPPF